MFSILVSYGQATDLIISEYVEGSSNNKYIELYNGTTGTINLSNYQLQLYTNGATTSTNATLSGTLAPNTTIVYKNSAATIYTGTATASTVCAFNGDDAIALFKISTSTFVDIIGNIGCDPGAAWTSVNTTLDKSLIRKPNVCSGITTDTSNSPCSFPTLDSEWNQLNVDDVSNLGTHTMTCIACTPTTFPTIQANTFTATPQCTTATLNWANGNGSNRIVVVSSSSFANIPSNGVNYSANSAYTFGAPIGSGNYVVYNGTGGSVTISGLTAGTTYYVHIFEFNVTSLNCDEAYYTSGNSEYSFTTNTSCTSATPQIRAILADACGSNEGRDELVIVENGSSPLSVSDITITFPTAGLPTYCNSGCGTNTLGNNPTYVNDLNTLAGCTLFYYADPIPANAMIVVFTGNPPTFVFNYSSLCPSSLQYYVVFCNNPTDLTGRFGNSGASPRTLTMTFGGTNEAVTYIPDNLSGNGSFVNFDDPGNPTYNTNVGCIYPLGNPFTFFNASKLENSIFLSWDIVRTFNASYFTVERMNEDGTFNVLTSVNSLQNNSNIDGYTFLDERPLLGANYYRIVGYDNNNSESFSDLRIINFENSNWSAFLNGPFLYFTETLMPGEVVSIFNLQGQEIATWNVHQKSNTLPITISDGVYLITVTSKLGKQETKKVILNN